MTNSTIELVGGTATASGGNLYNAGTVDLDGATTGQVYIDGGSAIDGGGVYNSVAATFTLRCDAFVRFGSASGSGGTLANWGIADISGADLHEGHAGSEGGNLYNAPGATASLGVCDNAHKLSRVLGGHAQVGANAANHGTLRLLGRTVLSDGVATISGGAISTDGIVQVMAGAALEVTGNIAPVGAAFALIGGSWTTSAESQSLFTNNSASTGSGIIRVGGGTNQITNADISANTIAGDGSVEVSGGSLDLSNSSITANTTTGVGVGPGLTVTGGITTVLNSTVATGGTSAAAGLVRLLGGRTALQYTTVSAPGETTIHAAGGVEWKLGASLVNGSCSNPGATDASIGDNVFTDGTCPQHGNDAVSADAGLLDPLASHLGVSFTMVPQSANPAIDHVAGPSECPATDQDFRTRPTDGDDDGIARCDAGAYETSGASGGGGGPDPRTAHVHAVVRSAITGLAPAELLCLAAFRANGDVIGGGEGPLGAGTIDIDVIPGSFALVTYPCDHDGDLAPGATHRPEWFEDQAVDTMAILPWPGPTTVLTIADGATTSIEVCLDGADQAPDHRGLCPAPPVPAPVPPPPTPPPGVIGGHVEHRGGETVCVAAVTASGTEPAAWTVAEADGAFSLTVADGDYAVVAYRCDPTTGRPLDDSRAVWGGDVAVDSSTLFRPPRGATIVRPGATVGGRATVRLDLAAGSGADRVPPTLAFTGVWTRDLVLVGYALVIGGVSMVRVRRRRA